MQQEYETLEKNRDQYRGYVVLVIEDKIYAAKRTSKIHRLMKEIEKKYHRQPLIAVIPKADTLIV